MSNTTITLNGQVIDLTALDPSVLAALSEGTRTVTADRTEKARTDLSEHVAAAVAYVVTNDMVKESSKSASVGAYVRGIRVEHEGRTYSVAINITDTAATVAREPLFPKKAAKAPTKA